MTLAFLLLLRSFLDFGPGAHLLRECPNLGAGHAGASVPKWRKAGLNSTTETTPNFDLSAHLKRMDECVSLRCQRTLSAWILHETHFEILNFAPEIVVARE